MAGATIPQKKLDQVNQEITGKSARAREPLQKHSSQSSRQTFVIFGLVAVATIVACTAFSAYSSSLKVGFLLDDFSHLDLGYRVAQGDWTDLLRVFTSNWTGAADELTSYRPLISLSMLMDYLMWGLNPIGYHLTNIAMFAGCSVLTGLLAFELGNAYRTSTRLALMLISGLLFVAYPLHPESVAWIIGRVDVQCSLFYLLSLYLYLLRHDHNSKPLLIGSLAAFACALPSKEMAVTLPACLCAVEFILFENITRANVLARLQRTLPFWLMLFGFAVVRTFAIGALVGGYGESTVKGTIHALTNFLHIDSWKKVFYGVNEEVSFSPQLIQFGHALFTGIGLLLAVRLGERLSYWRTLAFLAVWAIIAELPTFQIWHIYPNLSGSRLLFIPSTPFCIALAFIGIPALSKSFKLIPNALRQLVSICGTALLTTLIFVWFAALQANLQPWQESANRMSVLRDQIRDIALSTPAGKQSLLLDLPPDHSGAGLLGRPEFLEKLLRAPLSKDDLRSKIVTAERPIAGSHEFINHDTVLNMVSDSTIQPFLYNDQKSKYISWQKPNGASTFAWSKSNDTPAIQSGWDAANKIYWLPPMEIDPFSVGAVAVEFPEGTDLHATAGTTQLVWHSAQQPKSWVDYSSGQIGNLVDGKIVFIPWNIRSWLFNGSIVQVGIKSTLGNELSPTAVSGNNGIQYMPSMSVTKLSAGSKAVTTARDQWAISKTHDEKIRVSWNVSNVKGAYGAIVAVTKTGASFYDFATTAFPYKKKIGYRINSTGLDGRLTLPASAFAGAGMHQIAVVATDKTGKPIGFVSEPRTVQAH